MKTPLKALPKFVRAILFAFSLFAIFVFAPLWVSVCLLTYIILVVILGATLNEYEWTFYFAFPAIFYVAIFGLED